MVAFVVKIGPEVLLLGLSPWQKALMTATALLQWVRGSGACLPNARKRCNTLASGTEQYHPCLDCRRTIGSTPGAL